jgi:hypothetical protein
MNPQSANSVETRRKSVRRTALWLAVAAVAVYVAFIVAGIYGVAGGGR